MIGWEHHNIRSILYGLRSPFALPRLLSANRQPLSAETYEHEPARPSREDRAGSWSFTYFAGTRSASVSMGLPTSPRSALTCAGVMAEAELPKLLRT